MRVTSRLLWLFLTGAIAAVARGQNPTPPNLLLITLDTTRADHLGCYGMKGAKTPVIDSLAARGALFEQAHSHVPLTLPSHATILSGRVPPSLEAHVNGVALRGDVDTLATFLMARGYSTAAVVASAVLNREYGLARGFSIYDDHMTLAQSRGGPAEERAADDVTAAALAAAARAANPLFLWVHYYDPHNQDRRSYDDELAYMDAAIGRLLAGLDSQGRLKNTLIVVAGDHGEGLGEHHERHHGVFLYEYALHVPLIFAWEGKIGAARRIKDLAGLDDVAPSILDLLGAGALPATDGRSLRSLLEGRTISPRPLYAESYQGSFQFGWAPLRAIITDGWKYIEAPRPELYRWRSSEETNLLEEERAAAVAAQKELNRYLKIRPDEKVRIAGRLNDRDRADERKTLTSLGYLTGNTSPTSSLTDPKDGIEVEEDLRRAREALGSGDTRSAKKTLISLLDKNPGNVVARSMLGLTYLNSGEYQQARAAFLAEIGLRPQTDTPHTNLGLTYQKMGNVELAAAEFKTALNISPRNVEAAVNLARIDLDADDYEAAMQVLTSTIAAGGESAELFMMMSVEAMRHGNWEKARFALGRVIHLDAQRHDAYTALAMVAYKQGRMDECIYEYQRALRVWPGNVKDLTALGWIYLNEKHEAGQALSYFRRAAAAGPYDAEAAALHDVITRLERAQLP